jgi:hypothetical protein
LIHIGVFILLLLSGERNFGVRLNKPYISRIPIDIPVFSGTHADLLVIVKINYLLFIEIFMFLFYAVCFMTMRKKMITHYGIDLQSISIIFRKISLFFCTKGFSQINNQYKSKITATL